MLKATQQRPERINMDRVQEKEGHAPHWASPSPVGKNSQSQSPSGSTVDRDPSIQNRYLNPSHLNLLTSFGLSVEDLEELSQYPDNQLTPENIPLLLQNTRKNKLAPKGPALPAKRTEKETVPSADGRGPTVTKKVIDYGHKSKYGYNEAPKEAMASFVAAEESAKGFQAQQPAAASSLISNPKNPTKELIRKAESQAGKPNLQAFPLGDPAKKVPLAPATAPHVMPPGGPPIPPPGILPSRVPAVTQRPPPFAPEFLSSRGRYEPRADPPNRPCKATDGQKSFQKDAKDPIKSPFGVVKASWLPDFSQTDQQKETPTVSQTYDYYAVTPKIFPHICSLCDADCLDKEDWMQHQNTRLHNEKCRWLLREFPEWAAKPPSSPNRREGDQQERHESRQRSASPSPKRSRHSSSGHSRQWTRSRSRSSGRHRTSRPRSRSPRRHPSPRQQSRHEGDKQERNESRRCSASPSPKRSRRSSSGHSRHRSRSRSRSSGRHRTSRPRSRSPWRFRHFRHWSRSPSRSPERSGYHSTSRPRSPWYYLSPRYRTKSPEKSGHHRTSRPRSRSPRRLPSPRHRSRSQSRSPRKSTQSCSRSQSSSSKERTSGNSTRSTEGRHAKASHSKTKPKERKRAHGSSDSRGKGHKDLERTRETTPCQPPVDKAESQEQTHNQVAPEGQSCEEPERSALASLAEKSVLQAMAQLQAQEVVDGALGQNRNSAQLAAGAANTSAVSSDLLSMIQQVATQVITAVLDSRETSATRASTGARDPKEIRKSKSVAGPSPQKGTARSTKAKRERRGGSCPRKGTSSSSEAKNKHKAGRCPEKSTSLCSKTKKESASRPHAASVKDQQPEQGVEPSGKAANGSVVGLPPRQGAAKSSKAKGGSLGSPFPKKGASSSSEAKKKAKAGLCPKKSTSSSSDAKNKGVASPRVQQEEDPRVVGQRPEEGVGSSEKAVEGSVMGLPRQQGTAASGRAETHRVGGACPQEGTAKSTKGKRERTGSRDPKKGTSSSCNAKKEPKAGLPPKKTVSSCNKAKKKRAVSPRAQPDTAARGKEEDLHVVDQWPEPGLGSSDRAAEGSVTGLPPQQGTATGSKAESQGVGGACPQEGTAVSGEPQNQGVAGCSQSEGTAGSSEAESLPAADPIPTQGPAAAGETEDRCLEVPSSQQDTGPDGKAKSRDTELELVSGRHSDSPSPQPGTPGSCKAENRDEEQKLVAGSVPPCPVTCGPAAKPRVWICGDSLVVSAQKRELERRPFGPFDWLQQSVILEWHGQEDLTWTQLVPTLQKLAAQGEAPDALVVHLGGKELLSTPWPELSRIIQKEVALLKEAFPKVRLLWSEMLPQNTPPAEGEAGVAVQPLLEANLVVGGLISSFGGMVIKHMGALNIGGCLSHIGLELFLEDIRNAVCAYVLQSSTAAVCGSEEGGSVSPSAPSAASASLVSTSQEAAVQGDPMVSSSKEASQLPRDTGFPLEQLAEQEKRHLPFILCEVCNINFSSAAQAQMHYYSSSHHDCLKKLSRILTSQVSSGPSPDSPRSSCKPRVWICGNSVILSAQKQASSTAAGSQLGLEQSAILEWHGKKDLKWIQLLPFLQNLATWGHAPDALIIHLGEKDLAQAFNRQLMARVEREWSLLRTLFPQARVIWSDIISQGRQEGQFRRPVMNKVMGQYFRNHGGSVIRHPRISPKVSELYLDEANLSHIGLDIFLKDIRNGIVAEVLQCSQATGGGLQEGLSLPPPASPAASAGLDSVSREMGAREEEAVSSSGEASSTQTSTGEAAVSTVAEASGVASPSAQPGTSGTCKGVNQDVEQELAAGTVPPCPGSTGHRSKPRVWICGHSLVHAAQEWAGATSWGSQLGLEKKVVLEWHGLQGMMWPHLVPFLQDLTAHHQPPDVLILHLGDSDVMCTVHTNFLIKTIETELFLVAELLPTAHLVWSAMIPWGSWPGLPSLADKHRALKKVNQCAGWQVRCHGGTVIKHPWISPEDPTLYCGLANLSHAGLDRFLKDLTGGILAHLRHLSWAARGACEQGTGLPPTSPAAPGSPGSVSQEVALLEDEAVSTEEASSTQTSIGEAAGSFQPLSPSAEDFGVANQSPQLGRRRRRRGRRRRRATSGTCKAENQDVEQKLVFGTVWPSLGEAAGSSQPVSIKVETSSEASSSPQPGTSGPCKAEDRDEELVAGSLPPSPGEAAGSSPPASVEEETSSEASPRPEPGTPGPCKAENGDEEQVTGSVPPWPEAAGSSQPVSVKAETSSEASPSPQPGTSGPCKDEEQQLLAGRVPPCPGEAAGSSQRVSVKEELPGVASPSPQPGTSGPCKAENRDQEQELVAGRVPPCPGEAAGSSQPVSIKAETSSEASPSPQPGTPGPCKAENRDEEQELVAGSLPPCSVSLSGEASGNSQPASIKEEPSGVASPSPQLGTPGPCKAEKQDEGQEVVAGSVPSCTGEAAGSSQPVSIKEEPSGVAIPGPQPGTSGPCKAENRDEEQELVAGRVPPCPEASGSSQPVRVKAETSSEASPSPQPGTPVPCKGENKDEEQELVAGSLPPCSGNPEEASKRRVWICGQSVVVSAEKQASSAGAGSQLGLEEDITLEWHGQEDLTWTELVPTLQKLAVQGQAPDVLIVHLGESDLECNRGVQLSRAIKKELALAKELFPHARILWSNLLLRRRGSGKVGSRTVNRARAMVNLDMGPFMTTLGGAVIEHPAILHSEPDFYGDGDGDGLSGRGLDVFLEDVKNGILAHLHS